MKNIHLKIPMWKILDSIQNIINENREFNHIEENNDYLTLLKIKELLDEFEPFQDWSECKHAYQYLPESKFYKCVRCGDVITNL